MGNMVAVMDEMWRIYRILMNYIDKYGTYHIRKSEFIMNTEVSVSALQLKVNLNDQVWLYDIGNLEDKLTAWGYHLQSRSVNINQNAVTVIDEFAHLVALGNYEDSGSNAVQGTVKVILTYSIPINADAVRLNFDSIEVRGIVKQA